MIEKVLIAAHTLLLVLLTLLQQMLRHLGLGYLYLIAQLTLQRNKSAVLLMVLPLRNEGLFLTA